MSWLTQDAAKGGKQKHHRVYQLTVSTRRALINGSKEENDMFICRYTFQSKGVDVVLNMVLGVRTTCSESHLKTSQFSSNCKWVWNFHIQKHFLTLTEQGGTRRRGVKGGSMTQVSGGSWIPEVLGVALLRTPDSYQQLVLRPLQSWRDWFRWRWSRVTSKTCSALTDQIGRSGSMSWRKDTIRNVVQSSLMRFGCSKQSVLANQDLEHGSFESWIIENGLTLVSSIFLVVVGRGLCLHSQH